MNTPATPSPLAETPEADEITPVPGVTGTPGESEGGNRVAALRAGLDAWRESGGHVKDPIEKLAEHPTSLRLAVTGKCWDRQGGDADPAPKWRIGNCGVTTCPLWAVRPWQKLAGTPIPKVLEA